MADKESNSMYYGVYYGVDGQIMLFPYKTQKEALEKLEDTLKDPRFFNLCKSTTVIKRDMNNFKDGLIFGCPKSLDMKEKLLKAESKRKK